MCAASRCSILGQYRRSAPPADVEAFVNAFKNCAAAAHQSYFAKYVLTRPLKVIGSTQRSPTDFIVQTNLVDPNSNQQPAEVDFRVRTDTGKPVLVDVAYQGIWLSLEQRDQFVAFLGQNNGDVRSLIAHLSDLAVNLGKPTQAIRAAQRIHRLIHLAVQVPQALCLDLVLQGGPSRRRFRQSNWRRSRYSDPPAPASWQHHSITFSRTFFVRIRAAAPG